MEMPEWLRTAESETSSRVASYAKRRGRNEPFLDKTLRNALSFVEDAMFNESNSSRPGFLQTLEPRLKVITLLLFIIAVSLQKSGKGIVLFSLLSIAMAFASKIPLSSFMKKLLPAAAMTFLLSLPVILNVIVEGDSLFVLFRFVGPVRHGPFTLPPEIAITRQGLESAKTLFLRVVTTVSFVFLITMTTHPVGLMKALMFLIPGPLKAVFSISYRYIFFLVRKIEQFITAIRSRTISTIGARRGRQWVASRMGLLFSISVDLGNELAMAMESRGYRQGDFKFPASSGRLGRQISNFKFSIRDILWLIFTMLFCGVMLWKS